MVAGEVMGQKERASVLVAVRSLYVVSCMWRLVRIASSVVSGQSPR
jgi:hypothetical protein